MKFLRHISFLKAVWLYTISAFGGPSAHIGLLIKHFCEKRKDVTKEEIFDWLALCQLLPGASSTQLLTLIGYKRGGWLLAICTFLVWSLPAVCIMIGLALIINNTHLNNLETGALKFIQPMAIGFMIYAGINAIKTNVKSTITWVIFFVTAISCLFFLKSPWFIPIVFVLSGLVTNISKKRIPDNKQTTYKKKIKFRSFWIFIFVFILAGLFSELARKNEWKYRKHFNLFENFYRFGSIVFGGGDVLTTVMLDQYTARAQNQKLIDRNPNIVQISKQELLTGAGLVRAVPGPVFSVSSFVGAVALKEKSIPQQIFAGFIAALGIFLPSILFIFFCFPIWQHLKQFAVVYRAMEGINAVMAGLIMGGVFYLLKDNQSWEINLRFFSSIIVIVSSFLYLRYSKWPTFVWVGLCCLLGFFL